MPKNDDNLKELGAEEEKKEETSVADDTEKKEEQEEKKENTYSFKSLMAKGKPKKESITTEKKSEAGLTSDKNADDEDEDEEEIKKGGLNINLDKYLIVFQKVSLKDKIFFTKNLGVMLKAGLSIGQALEALVKQTANPKFKRVLKEVEENVKKGKSFADSLKDHKKIFPSLFTSMIDSGEKSGNLEDVLKQLHKQMTRDHELRSKIRGAMIYPVIVICVMIGIGIGMMAFVVPKFISIFEEVNAQLPLPTKILIGMSNFLSENGLVTIIGTVIVAGVLIKLFKTQPGRSFLHRFFLKMPVLAPVVKKINLARFARTLSSLLNTNIPIVQSFQITAKILGNMHYADALEVIAEKIKKGEPVSKCLGEYKELFSSVIIQMVTVGEESGSLDDILDELAGFYEEEVDQTMKNLPTIIEPLLMVVLGLGVGGLAVAVLMPMYSLGQAF